MFAQVRHRFLRAQAHGLRLLDRAASRVHPAHQPPAHLVTGLTGEREALLHLRRSGYTIVARRWTTGKLRGDLDLVAWQGDTLCFIEVKTRSRQNPLDPAEAAVDREKRRVLRQMAAAYLRGFPSASRHRISVRFDLVSVYLVQGGPHIEIFPAAFAWKEQRQSHSARFGV